MPYTETQNESPDRLMDRVPAAVRWLVRRWGGRREVYISLLLWGLLTCVTAFHFFIPN